MHTQLIDNWDDFYQLGSEWNSLLISSEENVLFLTWEWISSWRSIKSAAVSPYAVVVRDNLGILIGIAPFYREELVLFNTITYHTLRCMADHATGAEYPNIIAAQGQSEKIKIAIFQFLLDRQKDWCCIWLSNLAGWTQSYQSLINTISTVDGLNFNVRDRDFSVTWLPDNFEMFKQSQSKNFRSNLRRTENKIMKDGDVKISQCNDKADLDYYLNTLFALHSKHWEEKGETGTFKRKPELIEFYKNFTPLALDNNWLRFYVLEVNGGPKAVQIGYVYNKIFHVIQEGFDTDYHNGVGNLLRLSVIENCIVEGITEYDFLAEFTEHKRRWSAVKRTGHDLFIWNNRLKNIFFKFSETWPTGRFLKSKSN